ncbi:RAD51-associated protein 1 [Gastrophryne carolinensis]
MVNVQGRMYSEQELRGDFEFLWVGRRSEAGRVTVRSGEYTMDRPVRSTKTVNYSQFMDLDNDEDFASSPPVSKKARVEPKKKEKREKPAKKNQEEAPALKNSQGKRLPVDEKVYQRDLEVALALSVQETSVVIENNENTPKEAASAYVLSDTHCEENQDPEVSFSNCSVDSSALGLDEITESQEETVNGRSRRQAASKAITEQRKLLTDDSDGEEDGDEFKPDAAVYVDSESDDSFSGEDEEFEVKKPKKSAASKGPKPKNEKKVKAKAKAKTKYGVSDSDGSLSGDDEEFKSKKSKKAAASKAPKTKSVKENKALQSKAAAMDDAVRLGVPYSTPVSIKIKPMPARPAAATPPLTKSPPVHSSPPVGMRRPAWTPPASGGTPRSPLAGVSVKSPSQGLRLGLSRLARVKPLHPAAVSH